MSDPYQVLGVERRADAESIRKAYKKLAREYHPDVSQHPDAEARFKEVNAAYEVLGDPEKRRLYDEFGESSQRVGFDPRQARAWRDMAGGGGAGMEDLLGSLFGAGAGRRPRRGADQRARLSVDFLTTVLGGESTVRLRAPDGSTETITVPVPAGASDGGRVRLKGKGFPPPGGGPCGDLVVELEVRDHPILRRVGNDLELDVPITVLEAMAGGSITIPTPTGPVKVRVPPGTTTGARLRLKGRGVQTPTPGHLYLILRPEVPTSDDPEVLDAARRLESAYARDVRAGIIV